MTEPLSQEEIDELLAALNTNPNETEPEKTEKSKIYTIHDKPEDAVKIKTFDFKRPDKFTKDQLDTLAIIHNELAERLADFLPPLEGSAAIEVDARICRSLLNILFGGDGNHINYKAELTDLEKFVMQKLIARSFDKIYELWKKVVELNPELKAIETDPRCAQVSPLDEMVLLVTCDCKICNIENFINICYPLSCYKAHKK